MVLVFNILTCLSFFITKVTQKSLIHYKLLFILLIVLFTQESEAQEKKTTNDARFVFRPLMYLDYSLYHWYQEPTRQLNETPKNVGQVLNVLPGLGAGFILGKKTTVLFSVDVAVKYFSFSLDIAGYEGMGAVAFPVAANFRFPVEGFFFLQLGGGVQWTQINIHERTEAHLNYSNPFFMTYFGELAGGIEENIYLIYFLRFGYSTQQAATFDFGVRIGLHGSLWD